MALSKSVSKLLISRDTVNKEKGDFEDGLTTKRAAYGVVLASHTAMWSSSLNQ